VAIHFKSVFQKLTFAGIVFNEPLSSSLPKSPMSLPTRSRTENKLCRARWSVVVIRGDKHECLTLCSEDMTSDIPVVQSSDEDPDSSTDTDDHESLSHTRINALPTLCGTNAEQGFMRELHSHLRRIMSIG
jgi:hypothetical protein